MKMNIALVLAVMMWFLAFTNEGYTQVQLLLPVEFRAPCPVCGETVRGYCNPGDVGDYKNDREYLIRRCANCKSWKYPVAGYSSDSGSGVGDYGEHKNSRGQVLTGVFFNFEWKIDFFQPKTSARCQWSAQYIGLSEDCMRRLSLFSGMGKEEYNQKLMPIYLIPERARNLIKVKNVVFT